MSKLADNEDEFLVGYLHRGNNVLAVDGEEIEEYRVKTVRRDFAYVYVTDTNKRHHVYLRNQVVRIRY